MKNKGYTLIELLGVMILLALLISLVLPSVINSIKLSSEEQDSLTNKLIINAAKTYIDDNADDFYSIYGNTYCISLNTLVENNYLKDSVELDGKNATNSKSVKVNYTNKYSYEIVDNNACTEKIITYNNGQPIYFDIEDGIGCTKEEYESSYDEEKGYYLNSNMGYNGKDGTGNQNSCLKFYAFNNDSKSKTINLILDHNTTGTVYWDSNGITTDGPNEVLTQLYLDTKDWNGTIEPKNYIVQSGDITYEIDYNDYKARLITANEIAKITNYIGWDEKTSYSWYFFDSKTNEASTTCTIGNITGCKYQWLYDRTNETCTTYGCLNNSDISLSGYWTSSINCHSSLSNRAWFVYFDGKVYSSDVTESTYGIRPVIEVLKTNL